MDNASTGEMVREVHKNWKKAKISITGKSEICPENHRNFVTSVSQCSEFSFPSLVLLMFNELGKLN